jgi:hypothetical protein
MSGEYRAISKQLVNSPTLQRLPTLAAGTIPNAGRKGKPRIRRGDLPKKATRTVSAYDVDRDARAIASPGRI